MMEEVVKEKRTTMKSLVEEAGMKINIAIMKPVIARARERVKEIHKMSQAKHIKIMRGNQAFWFTEPPEVFINGPLCKIEKDRAVITYQIYESENGRKKLVETKALVDVGGGVMREKVITANYKFSDMIVETIEFGKPIKTEHIDPNN